jgi:exosome complex protein LRP1
LKVQQKKQVLEIERQKILQSSMNFSNKCKSYKVKLSEIISTTKDLESETKFLDE